MAKVRTETKSGGASGRWDEVGVAAVGTLVVAFLFLYYVKNPNIYIPVDRLAWLPGVKASIDPSRSLNDYWNEYLLVSSALLLWVPLLYLSIFGKREWSDYGLAKGDQRTGWLYAFGLYGAMLVPLLIASRVPSIKIYEFYPINRTLHTDFTLSYFLYFELMYGFYLFCWEFFFRGFLTFSLNRWLGIWGIGLQAVAFMLLHLTKRPEEVVGSFIAALILAFVSLRAKSFLPAFWAHWAVALTVDILAVIGRR